MNKPEAEMNDEQIKRIIAKSKGEIPLNYEKVDGYNRICWALGMKDDTKPDVIVQLASKLRTEAVLATAQNQKTIPDKAGWWLDLVYGDCYQYEESELSLNPETENGKWFFLEPIIRLLKAWGDEIE